MTHRPKPVSRGYRRNYQTKVCTMANITKLVDPVEPISGTTPQAPPDPFDPANLRLSQSFTETVGVKKLLTTVPVRKPSPQEFVRVHPDPEYREIPHHRAEG